MNEGEALRAVRGHFESLFPKACGRLRSQGALVLLIAVASACRLEPRPVVIGLGYPSERRVGALVSLVANSGREDDAIRIVSEQSLAPGFGSATASEIDLASRLVSIPGMIGVVGHGGSREALMTAPIYNEAGIPQIVPTATSRRLQTAGRWTFTLAPDDSVEGEYLGRFVAEQLHARQVTVFYVLDEYGAGLRDGAVAALTRRGIRVLDAVPVTAGGQCPPAHGDNAFAPVVDAALLRGRPDVVVLATRQRESGCIVARINRRFRGMRYAAGDGLLVNADFFARAGNGAEAIYIAAFWSPQRTDDLSRAFVERFRRLYGAQPGYDDAMVYDALMTLVAAVRTVGPDEVRVRDWLASLGHTRPPLHGVTGPIQFPARPDRLSMTRIEGDSLALVEFR